MVVIVPAAGLSTRFPNLKPKYLLSDVNNKLMIERSIENYLGKYRIIIGVLKKHDEEYSSKKIIENYFCSQVEVVVLDEITKGPADTVYQIIKAANLQDVNILIKDCDSYFKHTDDVGNYVCVANAKDHDVLFNLSSKSFIIPNDQNIITDIVEKNIVSDYFCVGGYRFTSSDEFTRYYDIVEGRNERFVSNVIQLMIFNGCIFKASLVENYSDVGTLEAWNVYNKNS